MPLLLPHHDLTLAHALPEHDPIEWVARVKVEKYHGDVDDRERFLRIVEPFDTVEVRHNLLMTVGATDLWNGLSTAGLATPWNTTNTYLVAGDGSTAPAVGNTDMAAAVGTKLNAADPSSATNATPIVIAASYSPTPVVGQVVRCSGFTGAGAAAVNGDFELSVASAASITLLNSVGTGAITVTGALIQPLNRYKQRANASGSAVVTNNQLVYVATFATANGNFQWLEWGTQLDTTTNVQAGSTNTPAGPAKQLNRATPGGGLGTKTSAASWTLTVTLSLA